MWLANHNAQQTGLPADTALAAAAKAYDEPDYQTEFDLFFDPSWLENPRSEPFDSTAYDDPS